MLRPPTEPEELNRSISLYLREITASMFWKIVFSFSAEFLKSSGHHDIRKNAASFCHMFDWGDERRFKSRLQSQPTGGDGELQKPSRGSGQATNGQWAGPGVPPMSVNGFWTHTKYVFPNTILAAIDLWCCVTVNFPYMATRFSWPSQGLGRSCLHLHGTMKT